MMPIENRYTKKLKAVIADRDEAFGKKVKKRLEQSLKEICLDMEVSAESDEQKLLNKQEVYDLYFISLDAAEQKGGAELESLELAKKLRKRNVDSEIVFVGAGEEAGRWFLCVKPLAYVRKRELDRDLEEALRAFRDMWPLKHKKIIVLDSQKPCLIEPEEIKFCQSIEHYVKFYRREQDYVIIRNSIKEIAKALAYYSFVRINVRTLVNMQYITSLENDKVTLEGGREFMISKTYRNVASNIIWRHFNEISYPK